jgi:DinB superfamily
MTDPRSDPRVPAVPPDWPTLLVGQLADHWDHHLRPGLDGLTDEEYRWEPVPGMWNVRRRGAAATTMAAGAGDVVMDFEMAPADPPPMTTIAWRLAHLGRGVMGIRAADHFGDGSVTYQDTDWPWTAAGALAMVDESYAAWTAGIGGLDETDLARPCGPAEGPWAEHPFAALVLHVHREVIHHGAEVLLLRDLYRNRTEREG